MIWIIWNHLRMRSGLSVAENDTIKPREAAMLWKQADDAVSRFISRTYDGSLPGQEEALADELLQKYAVLELNVEATDSILEDGYSIEAERRAIDPHYHVMRTAEETQNAVDRLETTVSEYDDVVAAYLDDRLSAEGMEQAVEPRALQQQMKRAETLRDRAGELLHEREHAYAAGVTGYMAYGDDAMTFPAHEEIEEERDVMNTVLDRYDTVKDDAEAVQEQLMDVLPGDLQYTGTDEEYREIPIE